MMEETFIYVVGADSNPQYTPELSYRIFLTKTEAEKAISQHPEFMFLVSNNPMECPSCVERNKTTKENFRDWVTQEWLCGFDGDSMDEKSVFTEPKTIGNTEEQSTKHGFFIIKKEVYKKEVEDYGSEIFSDGTSMGTFFVQEYECPRCESWKLS